MFRVKKNPIIVNVSRGQLVEEQAILNSLNDKTIRGYASDVLSDDSNWDSQRNLQGGERKILWDADYPPLLSSDILLHIGNCKGLTLSGNGLSLILS